MLDPSYLDAIKKSEGYSAEARWDYAQNTNGYGTRARYAGEVIDKTEADRRFAEAIGKAADFVDKFAPNLDEGSKAALTSLTYNAGTGWAQSGLGEAVASGDIEKAQSIFLQYNKAGGSTLDGLVQRRLQEVAWFGGGTSPAIGESVSVNPTGDSNAAALAAFPIGAPSAQTSVKTPDNAVPFAVAALPATGAPLISQSRDPGVSIAAPGLLLDGRGSDPALVSLLAALTKSDLLQPTGHDGDGDRDRQQDSSSRAV